MGFWKMVARKIVSRFWPEKIPNFAASVYIRLAEEAKPYFYRHISREIVDAMSRRKGAKNILDIGCGPGFLLFEIAELRPDLTLVGADLCDKFLDFADAEKIRRGCSHVFFMKCDANHLNFIDGECDFIISSGVLHSLKKPAMAIKEWLRILKPGGDLWIYDPAVLAGKENAVGIKKALKEMENRLKFKDRLLFRLMHFISNLPPGSMSLEKIEKIIEDAEISYPVSVKDNGEYIKIEIIKTTVFRLID